MAIQPLIPPITQAFTSLGQALAPLAMTIGAALVSIFQALTPILEPMVSVVLALVNAFLPLIPAITSTIQVFTPIIALIAQVAATIISFMVGALQPMIDIFGVVASVVGSVMTTVNTVISGVVSKVTGIFSGFLSFITTTWNNIRTSISDAVGKIRQAISDKFSDAVEFVKGIPGKILGALGDLGGLLLRAGRAIIEGLLNGIKNAIGGVYDFVSGIAGKIASLKGPLPYDRKVLVANGQALMFGLGVGLEDGFQTVQAQVSSMADRIQEAFGSPTLDVAAGVSGAVNATVKAATDLEQAPINVNISGDENGLRQFVQVEVQEGNRDTRRYVKARKKGGVN